MTWTLSAFADEAADSAADQIAALTAAKINHVDLRMVDGINIVELPTDQAKAVKQQSDEAYEDMIYGWDTYYFGGLKEFSEK